MVNIVTGITAMAGAFVFLGFYLSRIDSMAFWTVVILVMGLALTDLVKTIRREMRSKGAAAHNGA